MICLHTLTEEGCDHGIALRLNFTLSNLNWIPRDESGESTWEGDIRLTSGGMGRLHLTPSQIVDLMMDPEETDDVKAQRDALARIDRYTAAAWDDWLKVSEAAEDPLGVLLTADDAHHEEGLR